MLSIYTVPNKKRVSLSLVYNNNIKIGIILVPLYVEMGQLSLFQFMAHICTIRAMITVHKLEVLYLIFMWITILVIEQLSVNITGELVGLGGEAKENSCYSSPKRQVGCSRISS